MHRFLFKNESIDLIWNDSCKYCVLSTYLAIGDPPFRPNKTSDLLLIKNTSTNELIITTNPMARVTASWAHDGRKNIRAEKSRHVDSVHVE
jgi:hypothetical protein